jgi:hypothetical protein
MEERLIATRRDLGYTPNLQLQLGAARVLPRHASWSSDTSVRFPIFILKNVKPSLLYLRKC